MEHPKVNVKKNVKKLTELFERLKLEELTRILLNNKTTQEPTYIHSSCRTYMNYLHVHLHEQKKSRAYIVIKHIHIVQTFIRAERTSNWSLHIVATKSILNLFVTTYHTSYVKAFCLYIQSMKKIQQHYALVFEQFLLGNRTVKRF